MKGIALCLNVLLVLLMQVHGAVMPLRERVAMAHEALLAERRIALPALSDPYGVPPAAEVVVEDPEAVFRNKLYWKRAIMATVFWVGELPTENNPVPNTASAWDKNWTQSFGGYDDPEHRSGYLPVGFLPKKNPFYIALPYNDIGRDGRHRPEVAKVIPWYWSKYTGDSVSVCRGTWVAIHYNDRICYAQWEDVGPFEVDHFQYVFGFERPRGNRNQNAGIDISPAVRDFLGLKGNGVVDWRFAHPSEVPKGPWLNWGQR